MNLGEIVERLSHELGDVTLRGDAATEISSVASLESAKPGEISFYANTKYRDALKTSGASAVILSAVAAKHYDKCAIVCAMPYLAFAKVSQWLNPLPEPRRGIDPSAIVDGSATIDGGAYIGPGVIIEENTRIESGVQVFAGVLVGKGATIGAHTRLERGCIIADQVTIGEHCHIFSGAVIGAEGFGFAPSKQGWQRVPQLGSVRIGNRVSVGANTTIDRGALDDTIIEDGVILDNLVQIAHNVRIGANSAIAGLVGIAGSSVLGKYCIVGGGCLISGHLHIADNVHLTGDSSVAQSIDKAGVYSSTITISDQYSWRRNVARLTQLNDMAKRVKLLEIELQSLRLNIGADENSK